MCRGCWNCGCGEGKIRALENLIPSHPLSLVESKPLQELNSQALVSSHLPLTWKGQSTREEAQVLTVGTEAHQSERWCVKMTLHHVLPRAQPAQLNLRWSQRPQWSLPQN